VAPHRYWRLYITAANGGAACALAELKFGTPGSWVDVPTPATHVTASSDAGAGFEPWNLFDNQIDFAGPGSGLLWRSAAGMPQWVEVDFGSPVDVTALGAFTLTSPDAPTNQTPRNFELQGSDIGGVGAGDWATVWTVYNAMDWNPREVRTFTRRARRQTSTPR